MFMPTIATQVPGLLTTIKSEHDWLKKVVVQYNIDAVISDNRYGLYHDTIPCFIMTHQLQVMSGWGSTVDNIVRKLHYKYLDKFNECWIVDDAETGLAGKLSHPAVLPQRSAYMGLLSQLSQVEKPGEGYLLVLLSGPEPQRSILSDMLWQQLKHYDGKVVFVEGSMNTTAKTNIPAHITYHQQIVKAELEKILSGADIVICRSGYSTLMDLVRLNKKAILIPTPGQTEQEYLAEYLRNKGIFTSAKQNDFDLMKCLDIASRFEFKRPGYKAAFDIYKQVIDSMIAGL